MKNISFLGHIKEPNLFYRTAHVFISPSLLDAHPATIAEAMYCGLPVIVSDGCGSKSLVEDNVNGFIIPSRDSVAIENRMKWCIGNQCLLKDMGRKARETILYRSKSDQSQKCAKHIVDIIEDLSWLSKKNSFDRQIRYRLLRHKKRLNFVGWSIQISIRCWRLPVISGQNFLSPFRCCVVKKVFEEALFGPLFSHIYWKWFHLVYHAVFNTLLFSYFRTGRNIDWIR